jgi:transglutaminase-like putative cysteine protease
MIAPRNISHWKRVCVTVTVALLCGLPTVAQEKQRSLAHLVTWSLSAPSKGDYGRLLPSPERQQLLADERYASHDLLYRARLRFRSDGTIRETIERARYFRTEAGVQSAGNFKFWFDAFDTRSSLELGHTLLPDERSIPIAHKDVVVSSGDENDVFSGEVSVSLPFQALEPGAITLARMSFEHDPRLKPVPWSAIYAPETFTPLERFEVVVEWDDEKVAPRWSTTHPRLVETGLGAKSVSFVLERASGVDDDPDRLSDDDVLSSLVIAQPTTWREMTKKLATEYWKRAEGGPLARKLLGEILQPEDTPRDKAAKIQRFVSSQIRYVGFERGSEGVIPRPSELTLQRRFGDCKDMTVLFVDLARLAGLQAYPVLVSSTREDTREILLPSTGYFDHLIACVRLPEERCVDLTASSSRPLELPGSLDGSVRLDLPADGADRPRTLPAPAIGWRVNIEITRKIQPDGSVVEYGMRRYEGSSAASIRSTLVDLSREELIDWAKSTFEDAYGDRLRPKLRVQNVDDVEKPLEVVWEVNKPTNGAVEAGGEFEDADGFLLKLRDELENRNRSHTHPTNGLSYTARTRYVLPAGFVPKAWGPSLEYSCNYGSLKRSYAIEGDSVIVNTKFEVPRQRIPIEQSKRFNRFIERAAGDSRQWFGIGTR